jgi:hypothetical protein
MMRPELPTACPAVEELKKILQIELVAGVVTVDQFVPPSVVFNIVPPLPPANAVDELINRTVKRSLELLFVTVPNAAGTVGATLLVAPVPERGDVVR